jgi:hypothetical protein
MITMVEVILPGAMNVSTTSAPRMTTVVEAVPPIAMIVLTTDALRIVTIAEPVHLVAISVLTTGTPYMVAIAGPVLPIAMIGEAVDLSEDMNARQAKKKAVRPLPQSLPSGSRTIPRISRSNTSVLTAVSPNSKTIPRS